jgi:hypothetical protein
MVILRGNEEINFGPRGPSLPAFLRQGEDSDFTPLSRERSKSTFPALSLQRRRDKDGAP